MKHDKQLPINLVDVVKFLFVCILCNKSVTSANRFHEGMFKSEEFLRFPSTPLFFKKH